jgi:peptidoglycan/LPS O-acetylase OafA/YrhL
VALGAFWIRRVRRLLPAALASLLLAQIVTLLVGDAGQRHGLGGDTIGALLYSANWRSVLAGQSYGDLFQAPSPLLHFWSLAVEEQFYLLYPLLMFGVLAVLGWSRRRLLVVLGGLTAVSVGLLVLGSALGWSVDRLYYGTDTRMAEVLIGAIVAVLIAHRIGDDGLRVGRPVGVLLAALGAAALVVTLGLWWRAAHEQAWLYRGGLPLYAVGAAAVIVAGTLPFGPVRVVLATSPLQWLGRISYGLYLYHWPVFLLLNPTRTNLDGFALLAVRLAVTVPIAMASYRWIELPFRRGAAMQTLHMRRVAPFAVGSLLLVGVVVSTSAPQRANDFAAGAQRLEEAKSRAAAAGAPAAAATGDRASVADPGTAAGGSTAASRRMAVFGDSTALATGLGLGDELTATGAALPVGGAAELGCGIGRRGERRTGDSVLVLPDRCNQWESTWPETVRTSGADLAVVQIGPWDAKDRRLDGDTEWRSLGDPTYDAFVLAEMTKAVDVLSSAGARVVWLTTPPVADRVRATDQPEWRDPPPAERIDRFNALVRRLPELRPGKVAVVDLAGWLAASGRDEQLRPDGVHLADDKAREVAREWLARAVLDADASLPR